jgi:hypothetical protein
MLSLGRPTLKKNVSHNRQIFAISTVKVLKICGIWYCNMAKRKYQLNTQRKLKNCGSSEI